MKIYIAGKVTGLSNYKEIFDKARENLEDKGHQVLSPSILPIGFDYEDYMKICFSMINVCDAIYFLPNWVESEGATREINYATATGKHFEFVNYEGEIYVWEF